MRKIRTKAFIPIIYLAASCILVVSKSTYALSPVGDAGIIVKLVKEIKILDKQYRKMKDSYKTQQNQLAESKNLVKDSEGHYGFGSLYNRAGDLKNREWSPSDWKSSLKGLSGGNPARYQQLKAQYEKNHPSLSKQEYTKGASKEKAAVYQQQVQANRSANVNATYEFNSIKKHIQIVHDLSQKIDSTPNTKAAIDLNVRLVVELAYIQIEELKMQSVLNEQYAQSDSNNIAAKSQAAKFNKLADEKEK